MSSASIGSNGEQVLGSTVISTVHQGSDWETQGDLELGSDLTSSSSLRHLLENYFV